MKSVYKSLVLFITTCSLNVFGQNVFTALDSALIACYPFSGNANDQSVNALHGTVNSAVLVADRFGNPNSAYSFGGPTNTANIVVPGFSSYLNGTGVSLCFWTAKTSYNYDCAFLMTADNSSNRFALSVYYGLASNPANYWDYGDISSNGRLTMNSNSSLPASNTWDHWVFTSSSTGMKAYKNGTLVSSKTSASSFSTSPSRNLCIGGAVGLNGGILWYNGILDDIRIYKRELLASEVSTLYSNNITCICPAVFTPTNATSVLGICAGNSMTLSASGSPTLQWYSSSSATLSSGTGTNYVIATNNNAGTYTYYVRAGDGCSTSTALPVSYTVTALPQLQTSVSSSSVCSGKTVSFQASGATNYTWIPGNGLSSSFTATPPSTTTYTLFGETNGCSSTKTIGISVITSPTISIAASAPAVCEGKTVTLTGSGATAYTWQPGNITSNSINVLPLSTTVYTLIGATSGCSDITTIAIPVANLPTVSISGSSLICLGKTALLLAGGAVNYTWSPGNIQSQLLSISPTSNTTFTVTGEASGCTNTAVITMSVVNPPVVSIAASGTTICQGQTVSLVASGAATYSWNTGSFLPSISVFPSSNTSYTVTGVDANNCSASTFTTIFVNPSPLLSINSSAPGNICAGEPVTLTASGADSYSWSNGPQSPSFTINLSTTTTFTILGTDANTGCQATMTYVQNVDECAGVAFNNSPNEVLDIFPNPNSGKFTLAIGRPSQVLIYNSLGEIVYSSVHAETSDINLESYRSGVYFITVMFDSNTVTRKIIKE
ncbi:MAG: T9SS type A sorting domain-containing protein [Bacteroidia bacterium]|nr:T9SS type A sorting domain-containing protein [Bacteroidia bacterium]